MPTQHNIRRAGGTADMGKPSISSPISIVTKDLSEIIQSAPSGNEVWVWPIVLDDWPSPSRAPLPPELTVEEMARAERYKIASARQQFVTTRACLRALLGTYMRLPPVDVPIAYTAAGKPILADSTTGIHFNVSHTDGVAMIAIAARPVGIDIERLRMVENPDGLICRFFSQMEQATYLGLPTNLREAGFFRGWTSKEALIKARGLSIACLGDFDVELHPDRPAALIAARHFDLVASTWHLTAWAPAAGYAAAVALEGG